MDQWGGATIYIYIYVSLHVYTYVFLYVHVLRRERERARERETETESARERETERDREKLWELLQHKKFGGNSRVEALIVPSMEESAQRSTLEKKQKQ